MYSFPHLEPVCCSMSSSNCCFLTCKQISQEAGQVIWYSHLLKNFLQVTVIHTIKGFQFSSVPQSCLSLQPHGLGPGLPVHHKLLEFIQIHVPWVGDAIQPSHPLSSPSPPTFNLSQHQGQVKGFGIVSKAEVDVFLELSYFFDDPADVGNLISGSSVFSKTSLNIWKFTVYVLLKPELENFEYHFTSM